MDNTSQTQQIPKIPRPTDVGKTPFQVIRVVEKLLQGWDKQTRKTYYLFKGNDGWCYYNPQTKSVSVVNQWRGHEANIEGMWIEMGLYYKYHLFFPQPITITRRNKTETLYEGTVNLTKRQSQNLEDQRADWPEDTFFRFTYKSMKKNNQTINYIDSVTVVPPANVSINNDQG